MEESEWSVIFYDGVDHASYSRANDTEESDDDDDDDWLMGSLGFVVLAIFYADIK